MTCVEEFTGEPGGRVVVDLAAVRANYEVIASRVAPARAGAVVKADAYGLGAKRVAPVLATAGCRDFFVALMQEALPLGPVLPADARIHVLNGLAPGDEALCAARGIRPVLNSLAQARRWRDLARASGRRLPAAVQLDSGMSRLGLAPDEVESLCDGAFAEAVEVSLVMTHLACADTPDASANIDQLDRFQALAGRFGPGVPWSIANSGGSFMAADFHGQVVRPGLALFGADPNPAASGLLRPVVRLDARVLQVRRLEAGVGVGYGLTFRTARPSRIATLSVGYADGWPRRLGGRAAAWFEGNRLPIVGRISMDSMAIDVTDLAADALAEGGYVQLIGPDADLAAVARQAETIPYEILTGLGRRLQRVYVDAASQDGERPA